MGLVLLIPDECDYQIKETADFYLLTTRISHRIREEYKDTIRAQFETRRPGEVQASSKLERDIMTGYEKHPEYLNKYDRSSNS